MEQVFYSLFHYFIQRLFDHLLHTAVNKTGQDSFGFHETYSLLDGRERASRTTYTMTKRVEYCEEN